MVGGVTGVGSSVTGWRLRRRVFMVAFLNSLSQFYQGGNGNHPKPGQRLVVLVSPDRIPDGNTSFDSAAGPGPLPCYGVTGSPVRVRAASTLRVLAVVTLGVTTALG